MTPEQIVGLLHDLLLWRQAQKPSVTSSSVPGDHIGMVSTIGEDRVAVIFTDGTTALLTVTIEGGQS